MVKSLFVALALGAISIATPAAADHILHLDDPFPSRGACESARQSLSNDDDFLLDAFPNLFSSHGEVRSFLNKAFTCERSTSEDQWYITDHRSEVLASEWFQRRQ